MSYVRFVTAALTAMLATGCGSENKSEPNPEPKASATPSDSAKPVVEAIDASSPIAPIITKAETPKPMPEPTPEEIDTLQKVAAADGFKAMGPQSDLWTALFALKQWHIMTFPNSKSIPPGLNIETHDGKKWVMVFTDTDRLFEYAKARKQLDANGTMLGMAVPSQTSFKFFDSLVGIEGVRFNEGDVGWFAPMGNLRAIHSHLVKLGRVQVRPVSADPSSPGGE